jgi:hypothetical protein
MGRSLSPRLPTKLCHWLQRCGCEVVDLTRYITDLASSGFLLAGPLKSTCLTSDLEETLLWTNLSPSVYKTPTPFSSSLRYKTWCMVGRMFAWHWWLWKYDVYHVPYIHPCQSTFLGIRLFTVRIELLCVYRTWLEYTRPVDMNIHLEACSYPLFIMTASDTLNHSLKFHRLFLYNM